MTSPPCKMAHWDPTSCQESILPAELPQGRESKPAFPSQTEDSAQRAAEEEQEIVAIKQARRGGQWDSKRKIISFACKSQHPRFPIFTLQRYFFGIYTHLANKLQQLKEK